MREGGFFSKFKPPFSPNIPEANSEAAAAGVVLS
jgi:hypothetical protein